MLICAVGMKHYTRTRLIGYENKKNETVFPMPKNRMNKGATREFADKLTSTQERLLHQNRNPTDVTGYYQRKCEVIES
jgi:hypothetical protein